MMKKRFLFLVLGFILPALLLAQNVVFAPLGAVWTYNTYSDGAVYGANQYRYVVKKDTLMAGWNARVVQGEIWGNGTFVPNAQMTKYVSTVGEKVYYWVDNAFVLLYDFGAQPGDTIISAVGNPFPFPNDCSQPPGEYRNFGYIIDALGSIEVDGEILRTQYVHPMDSPFVDWNILGTFTGNANVYLTERIGSANIGTWFGGNINCTQGGIPATLRCYRDSEIAVEGDTQGLPCDSVVSTYTPLPDIACSVTFNHSSNEISVHIPEDITESLQFCLTDLLGRNVLCSSVKAGQNMLQTRALPGGIYVWTVDDGRNLRQRGKIYMD